MKQIPLAIAAIAEIDGKQKCLVTFPHIITVFTHMFNLCLSNGWKCGFETQLRSNVTEMSPQPHLPAHPTPSGRCHTLSPKLGSRNTFMLMCYISGKIKKKHDNRVKVTWWTTLMSPENAWPNENAQQIQTMHFLYTSKVTGKIRLSDRHTYKQADRLAQTICP